MTPRIRTLLAQIGSFALAAVLLYFALRGVDFAEIGQALRRADYTWLLPLIGFVILSHWLRAWRWKMLMDALPTVQSRKRETSTTTAFNALMIGYMVNYAAPRLGELVRSVHVSSRERMPFSSVFGTVVAERILDMLFLLVALAITGVLLLDRLSTVHDLFVAPLVRWAGTVPVVGLGLLTIAIIALLVVIFRRALKGTSFIGRTWTQRVKPVMASFREGLTSVLHSRRPVAIVVSTIAMWLCYAVMAHLPFVILHMEDVYSLTLLDSWAIMVIGALGIVVPSPGGTGSYHYITIQALVHLFLVDQNDAATYAVLSHAAQLVLYTVLGFTCLLIEGSSLRDMTSSARSVQAGDSPVAPADAEPAPPPIPADSAR